MKKFLSLFLSLVMLSSMIFYVNLSAYANIASGDYEYSVLADSTAQINKYTGKAAELEIPSEIEGYKVTSIGNGAFGGCSSLKSIVIPDGVTSIGRMAFCNCRNLTSITISDTLTSIGDSAFDGCSRLTSITIPNNVTNIGNGAFYDCRSLKDVYYNGSEGQWKNISIGSDNSYLTSANIHFISEDVKPDYEYSVLADGTIEINKYIGNVGNAVVLKIPSEIDGYQVTSIGDSVFWYYRSITSITIPDSVTTISNSAFSGCSGITSITIPDSVTSIGSFAFSNCSSLTSITIPDSVTSIGDSAFGWCNNLEKIVIRSNNCDIADSENTIPEQTDIYGYAGSTAQTYTEKYGRNFVEIKRVDALGGSIRITDAGLRFGFSYNESKNVNVEEYGFVYSYSETNDLTVDTVGAKKRVANKRVTNENNVTTFNLVFTGIPKSAYDTVISARAYVKIDGQYYYSDILQRSFNIVANAVLADETIDQSIKDTINDILNKEA